MAQCFPIPALAPASNARLPLMPKSMVISFATIVLYRSSAVAGRCGVVEERMPLAAPVAAMAEIPLQGSPTFLCEHESASGWAQHVGTEHGVAHDLQPGRARTALASHMAPVATIKEPACLPGLNRP
jgi:hypothetical protein